MKQRILLIALLSLFSTFIFGQELLLKSIEKNNNEIQRLKYEIEAQKLELKSTNTLPDPKFSYDHLWDSKNTENTVSEMGISQEFDFPTRYLSRKKYNRIKSDAIDALYLTKRQELLLQAKELYFDIIKLKQKQQLLSKRYEQANQVEKAYEKRLSMGDANILEIKKIKLEQLNIKTEHTLNKTELATKIKELEGINGNEPLPALSFTYPPIQELTPLDVILNEALVQSQAIQAMKAEQEALNQELRVQKEGWLPKLELGYRRNTELGNPFNGFSVGFSIPIFENRKKVTKTKALLHAQRYTTSNTILTESIKLKQAYNFASELLSTLNEYTFLMKDNSNYTLLKEALDAGEISIIAYFLEISTIYQAESAYIDLENEYQKAIAKLYKHQL